MCYIFFLYLPLLLSPKVSFYRPLSPFVFASFSHNLVYSFIYLSQALNSSVHLPRSSVFFVLIPLLASLFNLFLLPISLFLPFSFSFSFFILAFFFPHCEAKLINGVSCSQLNFGIEFRLFISFLRNFTDKENKENLIFWLHCDKILFREKALFCGRLKFFCLKKMARFFFPTVFCLKGSI